ncbi:MAG: hypothetical protein LBS59_09460 [Puniceicoccales bacterium]|nr:hypothetical protein [Puniceicoccales bacterium]
MKKTLLAGLGAVIVSKEIIENALHDWIEKGKITPDEAKGFAEKLVDTGTTHWEKTKGDLTQKVSDFAQKAPFAHRSELAALEARITVLEQAALRTQLTSAGSPNDAYPSTEGS